MLSKYFLLGESQMAALLYPALSRLLSIAQWSVIIWISLQLSMVSLLSCLCSTRHRYACPPNMDLWKVHLWNGSEANVSGHTFNSLEQNRSHYNPDEKRWLQNHRSLVREWVKTPSSIWGEGGRLLGKLLSSCHRASASLVLSHLWLVFLGGEWACFSFQHNKITTNLAISLFLVHLEAPTY